MLRKIDEKFRSNAKHIESMLLKISLPLDNSLRVSDIIYNFLSLASFFTSNKKRNRHLYVYENQVIRLAEC